MYTLVYHHPNLFFMKKGKNLCECLEGLNWENRCTFFSSFNLPQLLMHTI